MNIKSFVKNHRNKFIIVSHHVLLAIGLIQYNFWWQYVLISVISAFAGLLIFGKGLHHNISHKKYKDSWINATYTFLINLFTASGGPLNFSALHRHHHQYVDTDKDPHSPTHMSWWKVYFLFWKNVKINPASVRDLAKSKWILFLHRHQVKMHFLGVAFLGLIDVRLIFFVISPSIVYNIHINGLVNWLGHKNGAPRNAPEISWIAPVVWRHGDHHTHT